MIAPSASDVERFRGIVARRLGLHFDDSKLAFLAGVLGRRAEHRGHNCEIYLTLLESPQPIRGEIGALASELTVAETFFFRNPDQFRAFAECVVSSRMAASQARRRPRILAAGCASGEEAYSLAIILRETMADPACEISIRAADVNPAMIEKARRARYPAWSLRETPAEIQQRWFKRDGREFVLDREVRAMVEFEERNLVENDPDLWKPESYDVIFCRNVLMYLTPDSSQAVVQRISRSIVPGGYLFLGHAETLRGLSNDFHLLHTHGTFYYRRRMVSEHDERATGTELSFGHASELQVFPALVDGAETWVDAIRNAADRIQALAEGSASRKTGLPSGSSDTAQATPVWDLGLSLELLKKERFSDALDFVHSLPPESARDPEVLLLRAVLLTHSGQFERAEQVCGELLEIDELSSGAHYLLALCREGAGDRTSAIEQNQIAVYLDPTFTMPRLHLGLLMKRAGDRSDACREFGQALLLLQREEASRLLLFGGGFGRDALAGLCKAEIAACGGQP